MFHSKIRAAIAVIGLCLLLVTATQAKSYNNHSIEKGAWSCQFQVGPNFDFRSFDDAMFSIKKHFWDKSALRLGFSANYRNSDQDRESYYFPTDTVIIDESKAENDLTGFDINLVYIKYGDLDKQIKVYYGFGPMFNYYKTESQTRDDFRVNKTEQTTKQYGLTASLGGEWFVNKAISLMFEYNVLGYYQKRDYERSQVVNGTLTNKDTYENTDYYLDGFDAKFGISVYF